MQATRNYLNFRKASTHPRRSRSRRLAKGWRCLQCNALTVQPKIVQDRHSLWLVTALCPGCGQTNFHNKRANWIEKTKTPAATGVRREVLEMQIHNTT